MADKISYEQYASILEKIEQEMVATDDMLKESDDMFLLLRGRAGVGKTTVLNKLMFDWAKKEKEWTKQYVIAVLFNSRHLSNMLDWQTNYPKGFSLKDFLQQCSQYNVTLPEGWEDEDKILVCIGKLLHWKSSLIIHDIKRLFQSICKRSKCTKGGNKVCENC